MEKAKNLNKNSNKSPRASTITEGCRNGAPKNNYPPVVADNQGFLKNNTDLVKAHL